MDADTFRQPGIRLLSGPLHNQWREFEGTDYEEDLPSGKVRYVQATEGPFRGAFLPEGEQVWVALSRFNLPDLPPEEEAHLKKSAEAEALLPEIHAQDLPGYQHTLFDWVPIEGSPGEFEVLAMAFYRP